MRSQFLLVIILALAPLSGLAIYLAFDEDRIDSQEAQENARVAVRLVTQDLNRVIQESRDVILGFSRNPAFRDHREGCDATLAALMPSFPQFVNLGMVDRDLRRVCTAVLTNPRPVDDRQGLVARVLKNRAIAVGEFVVGQAAPQPELPIAAPIFDGQDQIRYIFLAAIDLRWLGKQVSLVHLQKQAILLALDRRGTVLARNPDNGEWLGKPAPPDEQRLARRGDFNGEITGLDGERRFYSVARVGSGDGLTVIMKIRSAEVNGPSRRRLLLNLSGLGIVGTLALVFTWVGVDRRFSRPLLRLIEAARRLGAGHPSARSEVSYTGEIGVLAHSFDLMADALQREQTETLKTSEALKLAAGQNAEMVSRLRALTARLESVREEERTHVAREIHDELGQQLTAIRLDLADLKRRLRDTSMRGEPVAPLLEQFTEVSGLVDSTIQTVRRIATELRPVVLDTFGLVAAIEWQAEDFQRRTKIRCAYEGPEDLGVVDRELSTTVFRICQEALTNVARHAEAAEVKIRMAMEGQWLLLEVRDNGKGVSASTLAETRSLGLLGMRERARIAGGELEIRSSDGEGVTVIARLPFRRQSEAATPEKAAENAPV